ncbi:MAG TPA: hypothetical protein VGC58_02165 [Candidatus Paceibacterota bacterium]
MVFEGSGVDDGLDKIDGKIRTLQEELQGMGLNPEDEMFGEGNPNRSQMRVILDEEWKLDSAQSPFSATDPGQRSEYEDWVRNLEDSRRAVQERKADLQRRISEKKEELQRLISTKTQIQ